MTPPATTTPAVSKFVHVGIWVAQILGAAAFVMSGVMKLGMPAEDLAEMMPWTGEYSATFVSFIGVVDLAGGLGLLLPSLTRVLPRLTVLAAACCVLLQILGALFHASRGEFALLPTNAVYVSFALVVLWGRGWKAPIAPRS